MFYYFLVIQFLMPTGQPIGRPNVDAIPTEQECLVAKAHAEHVMAAQGQRVKVYCFNVEDYNKFISQR